MTNEQMISQQTRRRVEKNKTKHRKSVANALFVHHEVKLATEIGS
jgi:hypothetical protein